VIESTQVLELLVKACPTFGAARDEHLAEWGNDMLYLAAGAFARHLLEIECSGSTLSFPNVGLAIERMQVEGTHEVQELATIGVLEGIQNNWEHGGVNPEKFVVYLGPEGRSWWQGLNNFWSGKAPHVQSGA
jgi:hypothetical protein